MKKGRRVVIVGGVAGGASCAARLRRNDEAAEIVMFERGPFVSFANCGLPYFLGGVIPEREQLVLATPETFARTHRIEVRTGHEVVAIDRAARCVRVRRAADGVEVEERYDVLVLAPGAAPLRPPLPGIDLPGVFTVRTIPDIEQIKDWIAAHRAGVAVVVGAGFIGLEMAENLVHLGLRTTVVEMLDQVMPPFDPEMVRPLEDHLRAHGVTLAMGDGVAAIEESTGADGSRLRVLTRGGAIHDADLVILAIGVRPESGLARDCDLELGPRGGIRVDEQMRTSDPAIFAVGDAVEVRDMITGEPTLLALAGPANRQGRIAADAICGLPARFRGVQGTAVCGVFEMAVGMTGLSEKALRCLGRDDFRVVWLHPRNHVGYYPGAETIHLKLIYQTTTGRLLGAQAAGRADVARKIDALAVALQLEATVFDLEEAELCYAPQFGAAKDALNFAGMIAANDLRGHSPLARWPEPDGAAIIDVRDPDEFAAGHHPHAVNIPLPELRDRLAELPGDRRLYVYCRVGQRGHNACRILRQHGFDAVNLSGGWLTAGMLAPAATPSA